MIYVDRDLCDVLRSIHRGVVRRDEAFGVGGVSWRWSTPDNNEVSTALHCMFLAMNERTNIKYTWYHTMPALE